MSRKPFLPRAGEKRLDRFLCTLDDAARHPGEAAVHDLRVAIRRLLAFLELAEPMPGGKSPFPRDLHDGLKKLMRPLGRLRDAHVKLIRIEAIAPIARADPFARQYTLAVLSDSDKWEDEVVRSLRLADPGLFRKSYRAIPLSPLPPEAIGEPALAHLRRREAGVLRLAAAYLAAPGPEPLHALRLAFKAYRYTAEALSALLPGLSAETGARLHGFQTLLGDIHDCDVLLAEASHFREKVLNLPGGNSMLEREVGNARDESLKSLLEILQNGNRWRIDER